MLFSFRMSHGCRHPIHRVTYLCAATGVSRGTRGAHRPRKTTREITVHAPGAAAGGRVKPPLPRPAPARGPPCRRPLRSRPSFPLTRVSLRTLMRAGRQQLPARRGG